MGILKKLGVRADAVANCEEVLTALESIPYDLVLMDVQMPEMDGFEATRRIRTPSTVNIDRSVPIIAMTAHAMQGDREKCFQAGMNDYLSKPISPEALVEVLERWLPARTAIATQAPWIRTQTVAGFAPKQTSPLFDKTAMMTRCLNDKQLALAVTDVFLADMPSQLATLRNHLANGDIAGVARRAHTIKGTASNISADVFRNTASAMEQEARSGDLDVPPGPDG